MSINREDKRRMQREGYEFDSNGTPINRKRPDKESNSRSFRAPSDEPAEVRGNIVKRTIRYGHDVRSEMSKVNWPDREEVRNLTVVVVVTLALMMALIFGLDLVFAKSAVWLFK